MARTWPKTILAVWLAMCAWIGYRLAPGDLTVSGDLESLLPAEDRSRPDELLVMLWLDDAALGGSVAGSDALLTAADAVHERVGAWTPMGPPSAEVQAWLDAHALFLLPVEAHGELRARLSDAAITSAVEGLRARLSSPLFGLSGEDARRDPLGLRDLADPGTAGIGRAGTAAGAELTAAGDLVARDGRSLLLSLHADGDAEQLVDDVRDAIGAGPVRAAAVGPLRRRAEAATLVKQHAGRLALVTLAGITLVLATALRRVRPALAILVALGGAVGLVAVGLGALDPLSLPLLVLLLGFGCEGSLHLQRISERGWPAATVLGTALLPLLLSPYPLWRTWSVQWLVAVAVVLGALRIVPPALLALVGGRTSWDDRGFRLRPVRLLSAGVTAAVLAAGAWASEALPYRGADRIDVGEAGRPPEQVRLVESFFDPLLVAEARSVGPDGVAALVRGGDDARHLATLVPRAATRIDSPGTLVLRPDELERRQRALTDLQLDEHLVKLRAALEARGFRSAAFGEFLRSADSETLPTPEAALDGPLGPWIGSHLVDVPEGRALVTRVHLVPDPTAPVPVITDDEGAPIDLHGPVIAARTDRGRFLDWLGIYCLAQLWLGALVVWIGTRSLAVAVAAAFSALVTETAVLLVMVPLHEALSPAMVPALLLVGAAATIAAGRACRAVDLDRPFFATGLLVTSLCQAAAGLALVASGVPVWKEIGLVAAIGAAVASGVGLFVAPGIAAVLRTFGRPRSASPATVEEGER